jgi:hypothetical protein
MELRRRAHCNRVHKCLRTGKERVEDCDAEELRMPMEVSALDEDSSRWQLEVRDLLHPVDP